jgi:hypothetical protein|tara:strand:- start:852 stop:1508 length:657 start_codon:yes stop_codon:yes gene_type:complete
VAFNVDEFRSKALKYGGAAPNLFEVDIVWPWTSSTRTNYNIKTTFLPASISTSATVNYLGRVFKFAGERTYPQWTCTFLNDEDFKLRNALERWSDYISGHVKLGRTAQVNQSKTGPLDYQSSATLTQFAKNGNPIKKYTFWGLYPLTLTDIPVSWDTTNAIEEFTATFEYQWYTTNYITSDPESRTMSADNWIGKGAKLQREKNALDDDFDLTMDDDY